MAKGLFGGLGNLGGSIGGILGDIAKSVVPKDTPEGKALASTSELAELQRQESELLIEIGKEAYAQNPSAWPQDGRLRLIQQNIAAEQAALDAARLEFEAAEQAEAEEDAKGRCPNCGHKNNEGVKFCSDGGTPLLAAGPKFCNSCGAELTPGTKFCGECGAQQ
jgi:predicted RNA-binding Zn-ribbon protein involved in translation (DUF1610 family)